MSDEEDVIDKLENESRKKNDDSDEESDEEYKIEEKEKLKMLKRELMI